MPRFADHLTQVADILASETIDGEVRVNLGDAITGKGWGASSPVWGIAGFVSRPNDADADGCAMAMYVVDGNAKRVYATRDNRYADKVGEMQPGDCFIISRGSARFMLKAEEDSITIYGENHADGDTSMMWNFDCTEGRILSVVGGSYTEQKKDSIELSAGGSKLRIDSSGVSATGAHFSANTKSGNLGVVGNVMPPAGASSIVAGPSGMSGVGVPLWTVSPG